ncbi:MAG: glycosyltransferase family 39 protein [Paracoccaceae bacterium]
MVRPSPIVWLLLAALAWRMLLATILPIGTDEAYEIAVGRDFALSFFDHPPLGFWAPALAELLGADGPLGYRLPTLLFGTLGTWLLYLVGREIGGERVGLWAAGLGVLAPFTLLAGVIILPDGPLYPAMLASTYALLRLERGGSAQWWWLAGGALGLAMASKYQAALFGIGAFAWIVVTPSLRVWFRRPGLYGAILLALAGIAPVILWNVANGWASLAFHSGRAGAGPNPANAALMLLGQMVYLLPPVMIAALLRLFNAPLWTNTRTRLLLLSSLPTLAMFNAIYTVSERSLPHWTMPGWLMLLPLVAAGLADRPRARRWLWGFAIPAHALLLIAALHLNSGLLTRFSDPVPEWDNTAPNLPLGTARQALNDSGLLNGRPLIAAEGWVEGGHLGAILGPDWPIRILEENPHHFLFMEGQTMTGPAALIGITPLGAPAEALLQRLTARARTLDPGAEPLGIVPVERGGRAYFALVVVGLDF